MHWLEYLDEPMPEDYGHREGRRVTEWPLDAIPDFLSSDAPSRLDISQGLGGTLNGQPIGRAVSLAYGGDDVNLGKDTLARVLGAFPGSVSDHVATVVAGLGNGKLPSSADDVGPVRVQGQRLRIPMRVYLPPPTNFQGRPSADSWLDVVSCLCTRHNDGYVRQRLCAAPRRGSHAWRPRTESPKFRDGAHGLRLGTGACRRQGPIRTRSHSDLLDDPRGELEVCCKTPMTFVGAWSRETFAEKAPDGNGEPPRKSRRVVSVSPASPVGVWLNSAGELRRQSNSAIIRISIGPTLHRPLGATTRTMRAPIHSPGGSAAHETS